MNENIWIATSIFMIIEEYRTRDILNCDTPITTYNIGNWSIFLFILIIKKVRILENNHPNFIKVLTLFSAIFSFLFILAWTILGTFWIIKNYSYGNNCLGTFSLIIILTIQIFIYSFYSSFFYFFIKVIYDSISQNYQQKRIQENLINFYSSENYARIIDINEFCNINQNLLINTGLLEIEKNIVKNNFTRIVDKEEDLNCIICLNEFKIDEQKTCIGCSHFYHYNCLMDWCVIKPTCPCCKVTFRNHIMSCYKNSLNKGEEQV